MALRLSPEQMRLIQEHGARVYPNECCGVLLGRADGADKEVHEAVPLKNLRRDAARAQELLPLEDPQRESEQNRFLIDPKDQIRIEKDARERGLQILGYYHSHPDHPARPSNYDREHAWPWYSYVIVSVERARPVSVTSWVLEGDRSGFKPEPVQVLNR